MTVATNKLVIAIVLAAGMASRFGTTKQLVTVNGVTLVKRAVDVATASQASATTVVVGHDSDAVTAALIPFNGFYLCNENFADGMGSSLALAVRATRHAAAAFIVMLADQPLITPGHLDALIDAWSGNDDEIVATSFARTLGPPALFARACFDDLATLQGESGARALFDDPRFSLRTVEFQAAAVDIDEPADLSRL